MRYYVDLFWDKISDSLVLSSAAKAVMVMVTLLLVILWGMLADAGGRGKRIKITAPVPQTGQIESYYPGDDGDLQIGVPLPEPRFSDRGDGTVRDNLTGLIWLKDANCIATEYPAYDQDGDLGDGRVIWQNALDFVAGINSGIYPNCGASYTNCRLANVRELLSLINYSFSYPCLSDAMGTGQYETVARST